MPKAAVTLPALVSSVPTARHFVESILAGWGLDELGWNATLVVSELAANAALHARGESFGISVTTQDDDAVLLEVSDGSLRLPQQRSYSADATTGRGLRLVTELASDWGVDARTDGKTVWVVLRPVSNTGGGKDEVDIEALLDAFGDDLAAEDGSDCPSAQLALAA